VEKVNDDLVGRDGSKEKGKEEQNKEKLIKRRNK
jgi:hypothetical protein